MVTATWRLLKRRGTWEARLVDTIAPMAVLDGHDATAKNHARQVHNPRSGMRYSGLDQRRRFT